MPQPAPTRSSPAIGAAMTVAQVVPQNVEKIPLYHWRPGARLLVIGDRDGAAFDGRDPGGRSFERELGPSLLDSALERSRCDGLAAAWSCSLTQVAALDLLLAVPVPVVVVTSGHGPASHLMRLLDRVAAWCLLIGPEPGPHARRILQEGCHVEVLWGCDQTAPPPVDLRPAAAVHIVNCRRADATDRFAVARAFLAPEQAVYDERHSHSRCPCGADLVYRYGGRSRIAELSADGRHCQVCGASVPPIIRNSAARPG